MEQQPQDASSSGLPKEAKAVIIVLLIVLPALAVTAFFAAQSDEDDDAPPAAVTTTTDIESQRVIEEAFSSCEKEDVEAAVRLILMPTNPDYAKGDRLLWWCGFDADDLELRPGR